MTKRERLKKKIHLLAFHEELLDIVLFFSSIIIINLFNGLCRLVKGLPDELGVAEGEDGLGIMLPDGYWLKYLPDGAP